MRLPVGIRVKTTPIGMTPTLHLPVGVPMDHTVTGRSAILFLPIGVPMDTTVTGIAALFLPIGGATAQLAGRVWLAGYVYGRVSSEEAYRLEGEAG